MLASLRHGIKAGAALEYIVITAPIKSLKKGIMTLFNRKSFFIIFNSQANI